MALTHFGRDRKQPGLHFKISNTSDTKKSLIWKTADQC